MSQRLYTERSDAWVCVYLDCAANYALGADTDGVQFWHYGYCHLFTWQEWDTIVATLNEQRPKEVTP